MADRLDFYSFLCLRIFVVLYVFLIMTINSLWYILIYPSSKPYSMPVLLSVPLVVLIVSEDQAGGRRKSGFQG